MIHSVTILTSGIVSDPYFNYGIPDGGSADFSVVP